MLTVVIPAHNVERYIEACLRSVLSQTSKRENVYVIVVDDGSTDRTPALIREVVNSFPAAAVTTMWQHNQGLSAARNAGIDATSSEYVTFLDADDVWMPDYLDSVLRELKLSTPDILEYGAMLMDDAGRELYPIHHNLPDTVRASQISREQFVTNFLCFAWCRVYRTRLFSDRRYPIGRRFEDTATTPWLYWHAYNIVGFAKPLVGYRQRADSILASPTAADVRDLTASMKEALQMFRETQSQYWQEVAIRIHQQACSRIERLPSTTWRQLTRMVTACAEIHSHTASIARRLQLQQTYVYVVSLCLKRRTIDKIKVIRARVNHQRRTEK